MDLWQGPWNNQAGLYFKLSFHEKEQEQYQASVSELTKAMKLSDYCISLSEIAFHYFKLLLFFKHKYVM